MDRKAALFTLLLLAACGGGATDSGVSSAGASPIGTSGASSGNCLVVADQAPVGITLQSDGGLTLYEFTFYYDFVYGITTNNPQDKWGQARPFAPGTPVGTSVQLQLQPPSPDLIQFQTMPSTFPKGIPVELLLTKRDGNAPSASNSSSTAYIGKDLLGHDSWHTATVAYGSNATAVVTFFPVDAARFSISLTNVSGC